MLKTILIDDENLCLNRLKIMLAHYCPTSITVVGECQTVESALTAIETYSPDLIFLDVQLGSKTGFDLLGGVTQINFDVIFSTAHDEYALRAFQADAVDYLLKPIDADKLKKAVGKVLARSPRDRIEHQSQLTQSVDNRDRQVKRIGLPVGSGLTFIEVEDIVYCTCDEGRIKFFGVREKGQTNLLGVDYNTLTNYEESLNKSGFCRIHDSCLINMAYLKSYINGRGGQAEMKDGTTLNVSNQRKAEFIRRIRSGIF